MHNNGMANVTVGPDENVSSTLNRRSSRTRTGTEAREAHSARGRTVSGSWALNNLGQPFLFFLDHTSALLALIGIVDLRNCGDLWPSQAP